MAHLAVAVVASNVGGRSEWTTPRINDLVGVQGEEKEEEELDTLPIQDPVGSLPPLLPPPIYACCPAGLQSTARSAVAAGRLSPTGDAPGPASHLRTQIEQASNQQIEKGSKKGYSHPMGLPIGPCHVWISQSICRIQIQRQIERKKEEGDPSASLAGASIPSMREVGRSGSPCASPLMQSRRRRLKLGIPSSTSSSMDATSSREREWPAGVRASSRAGGDGEVGRGRGWR